MIHVDIVDDVDVDRTVLQEHVLRFFSSRSLDVEIRSFSGGEALLAAYSQKSDIILLDIQMGRLDGIQTAREIRARDEDVLILFVTNLAQYAIEGYSVNACGFMLKPVDYLQASESLERALKSLQKRKPGCLKIRQKEGAMLIDPQSVLYIETYGRKIRVHLGNEVITCTDTLQSLEKQLDSQPFFRCHNAYLINLQQVGRIVGNDIEIAGELIPLSKHRRKQLTSALAAYYGELL